MRPLSPIQLHPFLWMIVAALLGQAWSAPALGAEPVPSYCTLINTPPEKAKENRDKLFGHWETKLNQLGALHIKYKDDPEMKLAYESQIRHRKTLEHTVADICIKSLSAAEGSRFLAAKLAEKESNIDKAMCSGFASEMNTVLGNAEGAMTTFHSALQEVSVKAKELFRTNANENSTAITRWGESLRQKNSNLTGAQQQVDALRSEFKNIWGNNLTEQALASTGGFSISEKSFFGEIHIHLEKEQEAVKSAADAFASQKSRMAALETKCASLLLGESTALAAVVITDPATPPPLPPPGPSALPPPPAQPDSPVPVSPEKPGFFSENKELLIVGGAGAAAVGGLIYYKRQQDKKRKEEDEAFFLSSQRMSSSSSSSSGGSQNVSAQSTGDSYLGGPPPTNGTPPGSWLSISGIPSGASVNSNLTEISVGVVSPQGVLTQDSDTDISVSCEAPVPCSLTGTTTVNTDKGKAVFNDLRFTAPHTGVKLKFSASGFDTAVSPNTFDVTQ